MVVVTRRLRSVVATSIKDVDFTKDPVLESSHDVVGRPLEDSDEGKGVYQETHLDPTITFFKPHRAPAPITYSINDSNVKHQSMITPLTWIFGLATAIFLGVLIYEIALSYPYYPSTITPVPSSGLFKSDNYHPAASFTNLPSFPAKATSPSLNLSPYFPFPAK